MFRGWYAKGVTEGRLRSREWACAKQDAQIKGGNEAQTLRWQLGRG